MDIAVVDYARGNLSSVVRGLGRAGANAFATADPDDIARADAVVLPGVGAFADAMESMNRTGQTEALKETLGNGTPFLGICLGLQLLYERGDEEPGGDDASSILDPNYEPAWTAGLGLLKGSVTRLQSPRLKVPHVGWDTLDFTPLAGDCPLMTGISEGAHFYFTHSYALAEDADPSVVCAKTHYTRTFPSVIWKDNLFGCQFHPEKSSGLGQRILENFVAFAMVDEMERGA